jgi:hypothetical protein
VDFLWKILKEVGYFDAKPFVIVCSLFSWSYFGSFSQISNNKVEFRALSMHIVNGKEWCYHYVVESDRKLKVRFIKEPNINQTKVHSM